MNSRSTWNRLCQIDDCLRAGTYPNARSMSLKLGVTERTIMRDLAFLKHKRHLPIEYDSRRYGYYYSKPVDAFSKAPMTEADLAAILIAYKSFAQQLPPLAKPLRRAFQKLSGQLDQKQLHSVTNLGDALSFRPFAPEACDRRSLITIRKAVAVRRELTFNYRNWAQKNVRTRRVQPYHVICFDNRLYLLGYDHARQTIRTFALTRLSAPTLTRRRFTPPKHFDPNKYLEGSLGVMKGDHDYEVVIEFDAAGADLIRARRWPVPHDLVELRCGGARLRLLLSGLKEIESLVLSWGTHATVVRPIALRQRLAKLTSDLAARYCRP